MEFLSSQVERRRDAMESAMPEDVRGLQGEIRGLRLVMDVQMQAKQILEAETR